MDFGSVASAASFGIGTGGAAVDKMRGMVNMATNVVNPHTSEQSAMDELGQACNMSRTNRLYGFAVCFGLGVFFIFISTLMIISPKRFATTFTLGNLLAMGSTMFLMGPKKQCGMMFDPDRATATILYLCSLGAALFCSMQLHSFILTVVCIAGEGCALLWYCLSYIPFARAAVKACFSSCF